MQIDIMIKQNEKNNLPLITLCLTFIQISIALKIYQK